MCDPEREVEMEEDLPMDFDVPSTPSIDASSVMYSPSRRNPFLDFHPTHVPSSPQPDYVDCILSARIDDGNASSYTQLRIRSRSPPSRERKSASPEPDLIYYSPSRRFPSPEASLFYYSPSHVPPSSKPGCSQLISSDANASSSSLPLVRSPSPPSRERMEISLTVFSKTLSRTDVDIRFSIPTSLLLQKIKRKRKITLEDLQGFSGSRMEAAKSFEVSESTIKRRCRENGITDWRCRRMDKNSQFLSKPKHIIESIQGEGAEMANQMAQGSRSCGRELNHEQISFLPESEKVSNSSQIGTGLMDESSTQVEITPEVDIFVSSPHEQCIEEWDPLELLGQPSELNFSNACLRPDAINFTQIDHNFFATMTFDIEQVPELSQKNVTCFNHEQISFLPESEKVSNSSQIGIGLMEESSTQVEITPEVDIFVSSPHEQCIEEGNPSELAVQPSELNFSPAGLRPDGINFTQIDHNITATMAFNIEQVPESSQTNLSCSAPAPKLAEATAAHMMMMPLVTEMQDMQDTRTVTMKATYREDMIRFQLSLTSGIIELRKQVAERLMLEVGTFSIKYLDDDEDWILMTGDKDLQECFNISVSLGRKVIKLSIHDITPS